MAKKQRLSIAEGVLIVEYPTISKVFKVELGKYPESIRSDAMLHGFKQKFGDAASGGTPHEKYAEVQAIHASLLAGQWERTASFDMSPTILQAVANLQGLEYDASKGTLTKGNKSATPTEEQVKEWGANPQVRAEIARMRAEKAQAAAAESRDELKIDLK